MVHDGAGHGLYAPMIRAFPIGGEHEAVTAHEMRDSGPQAVRADGVGLGEKGRVGGHANQPSRVFSKQQLGY